MKTSKTQYWFYSPKTHTISFMTEEPTESIIEDRKETGYVYIGGFSSYEMTVDTLEEYIKNNLPEELI